MARTTHSHQQETWGTHYDGEKKWFFPSAVSETTHTKWIVRKIIVHIGVFSTIRRLEEEVAIFHEQENIFLTAAEITTFRGGFISAHYQPLVIFKHKHTHTHKKKK